ncbi:hypothetical protein BDD43_0567 [Mucilaginibacter gracilis]|uniref:Uncharacterized protein n=2 Tax=Mucilaginibacter TaxID=423349 RepID=H1YI82_9SPHI|nr:hypothetical protein Mucpa_2389 [Mucilaginibacter paludis DSM 18603]RKR80457.1 hypothetical protein BDD43_0567 [Mucilaginibacter gracilis]
MCKIITVVILKYKVYSLFNHPALYCHEAGMAHVRNRDYKRSRSLFLLVMVNLLNGLWGITTTFLSGLFNVTHVIEITLTNVCFITGHQ